MAQHAESNTTDKHGIILSVFANVACAMLAWATLAPVEAVRKKLTNRGFRHEKN